MRKIKIKIKITRFALVAGGGRAIVAAHSS